MNGTTLGTIVKTYDYTDEAGALLYQTVRYEPKNFRQRRPDGKDAWIWKLDGVRLVLYRLPELITAVAAGDPIIIVEGEKDADALHAKDCVATCNPMGAGKWRPDYVPFLRGAEVVIVADKDADGMGLKHAREVAASLRGVAKSVRIVEAKIGKDAHDHLSAGHTVEEFVEVKLEGEELSGDTPPAPAEEVVVGAPERAQGVDQLHQEASNEGEGREEPEVERDPKHEAESPPSLEAVLSDRFAVASVSVFFDGDKLRPAPRRDWVVPELVEAEKPGVISSRGGVGKSYLSLGLGVKLAVGEDPLGGGDALDPVSVVIVTREDSRAEVHRRFEAILNTYYPGGLDERRRALLGEHLHVVDLVGVKGATFGDSLLRALRAKTRALGKIRLLLLDPTAKLWPKDWPSIISTEGAAQLISFLDESVDATNGAAVLAVHHWNKAAAREGVGGAGASTGSQQIEDLARLVLNLTLLDVDKVEGYGLDPDVGRGYVELSVAKSNAPTLQRPLIYQRTEHGVLLPIPALSKNDIDDERVLRLLEAAGEPLDRDTWRSRCKDTEPSIPRDRADAARGRLIRRGLVTSTGSTGKKGEKVMFQPTETAPRRNTERFQGVRL
jgi:hypothetical protein